MTTTAATKRSKSCEQEPRASAAAAGRPATETTRPTTTFKQDLKSAIKQQKDRRKQIDQVTKNFKIIPATTEDHLQQIYQLEQRLFDKKNACAKWELKHYLDKGKLVNNHCGFNRGASFVVIDPAEAGEKEDKVVGYLLAELLQTAQYQRASFREKRKKVERLAAEKLKIPEPVRYSGRFKPVIKQEAKKIQVVETRNQQGKKSRRNTFDTSTRKTKNNRGSNGGSKQDNNAFHYYYSVGNFGIHPDYQCKFLGRKLFNDFLAHLRKNGKRSEAIINHLGAAPALGSTTSVSSCAKPIIEVRLETCKEWDHVCRFYESYGFEAFGQWKDYYGKGKHGVKYSLSME
ncbi:unnamed protein product [Amoebophrya sp. A120]|nr:unnamed protein product [Amoebophrya sp. A120]|eukprot:GSA120T00006867001.1